MGDNVFFMSGVSVLIRWTLGQNAPQQVCGWHQISVLQDRVIIQRHIGKPE